MDTISNEKPEFQLQFWDGIKKTYVPQVDAPVGRYRSWRRVLASKNWALKNPKHRPPSSRSSGRTVEQVQRAYLEWAESKGLEQISAYREKPVGRLRALFSGAITYMTLETHFAVTVEELQ